MKIWNYIELAARMMGLTEEQFEQLENEGDEYSKIEEMLFDKFNIEVEDFAKLVDALLPMTIPAETAVMGSLKHVLGVRDGAFFRAIVDKSAIK